MKRWWMAVGVLVLAGLLVIAIQLLLAPPLPRSIIRQLTFTLLVPQGRGYTLDQQTASFNAKLKVLTYHLQANGTDVIVSEQPTPDTFVDMPDVYDKLIAGMGEYTHFDTDIGSVHLTRPKEQELQEVGVLNTKGTLMFARASNNLTDDQWRQFFQATRVVK